MNKKYLLYAGIVFFLIQSCASYRGTFDESPTGHRIAAVGDSITYGFGITKRPQHSYPAQLQNMLGDLWLVGNFGKNGATLLKRGDKPYIYSQQYHHALEFMPDIVIVKLGTNDTKPENRMHLNEFVQDYMDLIKSFQNLKSHPVIFISYPVPAFGHRWGIDNRVITDKIIPAIDRVAEETGVQIIDLYSALSDKGSLYPDTIHPDREGASILAETVFNKLRDTILLMERPED